MSWDHNTLWKFHPAVTKGGDRTVGQRAADRMKAVLATWTALIVVLVFISIWMVANSHLAGRGHHFDPYPWILLNLCLSCFAALQCFVLLIANKRGEQIAAEIAQHTLDNTTSLTTRLEQNTRLTEQVQQLSQAVHDHVCTGAA